MDLESHSGSSQGDSDRPSELGREPTSSDRGSPIREPDEKLIGSGLPEADRDPPSQIAPHTCVNCGSALSRPGERCRVCSHSNVLPTMVALGFLAVTVGLAVVTLMLVVIRAYPGLSLTITIPNLRGNATEHASPGGGIGSEGVNGDVSRAQLPPDVARPSGPPNELITRAEEGELLAQLHVAQGYRAGTFGDVDLRKARHWFEKASEQGDTFADLMLSSLSTDGRGERGASQNTWLVFAEFKTLSQAMREAKLRGKELGSKARIVGFADGHYGLVVEREPGATESGSPQEQLNVPAGARVSNGSDFVTTEWLPYSPVLSRVTIPANGSATLGAQGLRLEIKRADREDGGYSISVSGRIAGSRPFSLKGDIDGVSWSDTSASVVEVDPSNATPEVLLNGFTGGAHCCSQQALIFQATDGQWRWEPVAMRDGEEGLSVVDLDGDGVGEFQGVDQSFLYTFDAYAYSFAPIEILKVEGGALSDRTGNFMSALRDEVRTLEQAARRDPDLVHSNGFLAGWVAAKMRIGEGREAWSKMLQLFDPDSPFVSEVCANPKLSLEDCSPGQVLKVGFPVALKRHLQQRGYWDPAMK